MSHQPLPCCDRCSGALRNAGHGGHVFGRAWLLDEQQVQWLHLFHENGCDTWARFRVEIDTDVDVRSKSLPQELHASYSAVDLLMRFDPLIVAGDTRFKARYAL